MSGAMKLSTKDLQQAEKILTATDYWREERSYKSAVHTVVAALLAPSSLSDPQFPQRLANVFKEYNPDYAALGLTPEQIHEIDSQLAESSLTRRFYAAMANLAGGKWGIAQFMWIPRAVEFELGEELRAAFNTLMSAELSLAERVDGFREEMYATQVQLKERGGFRTNWSLIAISMNFVAMLLGGYDPENYIFYAYGKLRKAFTDFGAEWPKGSAGHKYTVVCEFAKEVGQALAAASVEVKDLIDVQSFLWVRGGPGETPHAALDDISEPKPAPPKPSVDLEQAAKDLAAEAYWPLDRARKLVHMTDRWGQLLFQGPPGTGKTYVAALLARLLGGEEEGRAATVQFHPSYAYEDFVEGIRPKVTSDQKALLYEVRPGIFLRLVNRAREYPEERFFLIIDEMNRANLPRVLGELLFALEYRGDNGSVDLPYSGAKMWVPKNITIIGTMNSADRSIALVDAAVRRRFRHVDFPPDPNVARRWLKDHGNGEIAGEAAERLSKLNAILSGVLDADRLIGHTYVMRDDLTAAGFESVWDEDIEPVLREHLYNQPGELGRIREVFLG